MSLRYIDYGFKAGADPSKTAEKSVENNSITDISA